MGYIYLQPDENSNTTSIEENALFNYVTPEQINTPYSIDESLHTAFDQMPLSKNTFKMEQDISYATEYGNDIDKQGYLIGIELSLNAETFIQNIKEQSFQIIKTHWKNNSFHLVTFDQLENVLQPNNHIYKLSDTEDAFVIVYLEDPRNLGYLITDDEPHPPIAIFKGLLTARDDIYPTQYLKKPDFILIENKEEEDMNVSNIEHSPEIIEIMNEIFGKQTDES